MEFTKSTETKASGSSILSCKQIGTPSVVDQYMRKTLKQIRKMIVAVIGFTLLLIGIVMIALPGPAIVVIPFALAILATEFVWARKLLERVRERFKRKS